MKKVLEFRPVKRPRQAFPAVRPKSYLETVLELYARSMNIPSDSKRPMLKKLSERWGVSERGLWRWVKEGRILVAGKNQKAALDALQELTAVTKADPIKLLRGPG